jgi:hypothetical protein
MMMMTDPRLDRLVDFDPRSRNYPIRTLLGDAAPRSYTWPLDVVLDQGREGACVGFSVAHELRAIPLKVPGIDDDFAQRLYKRAQQLDPWPGEAYSGTSLLAGMKAAQEQGHFAEYRWAFNADDLAAAVSRTGPAVLGIAWHYDMYRPVRTDLSVPHSPFQVRPTGSVVGGHAILCRGYNVRADAFLLHNSWGASWGDQGRAWITRADLGALLANQGEAVVPVRR